MRAKGSKIPAMGSREMIRLKVTKQECTAGTLTFSQAAKKASQKDFSEVTRQLHLLQSPFQLQPEFQQYANAAPSWAKDLKVSCSS